MALQIIGANSIGVGIRAPLGSMDDLFVARGVTVGSTDGSTSIVGTGSSHNLDIQGMVTGQTRAIQIGDNVGDFGQTLLIGENAFVSAVSSDGSGVVTMLGNNSRLDNRGTIHGPLNGLCVGGNEPSSTTTILNSGLIEGSNIAIFKHASSTDNVVLVNTGEIRANASALSDAYVAGSAGKDLITNSGLIVGQIQLGSDDDLYDGRGNGRVIGKVSASTGLDKLYGGGFADDFHGSDGSDLLDGGGGDDVLNGGDDPDALFGGAGNDSLAGGSAADAMSGGTGSDLYEVDNPGDVVDETGGNGGDLVNTAISFSLSDASHAKGAIERLTLLGNGANGTGNGLGNVITGNIAINVLNGLAGNDVLIGGGGNDTLIGDTGNDVIKGDAGIDRLFGGPGNDNLTGGAQLDHFVFNTGPHSALNRDVVTDFVHGGDKFLMENAVFGRLGAAGALNAGLFWNGPAAHDANDSIVYNKATGALFYDVNGSGAGGAVMFAVLANKPVLTASDFVVI